MPESRHFAEIFFISGKIPYFFGRKRQNIPVFTENPGQEGNSFPGKENPYRVRIFIFGANFPGILEYSLIYAGKSKEFYRM